MTSSRIRFAAPALLLTFSWRSAAFNRRSAPQFTLAVLRRDLGLGWNPVTSWIRARCRIVAVDRAW